MKISYQVFLKRYVDHVRDAFTRFKQAAQEINQDVFIENEEDYLQEEMEEDDIVKCFNTVFPDNRINIDDLNVCDTFQDLVYTKIPEKVFDKWEFQKI